jgi:hypothetical protein
VHQHYLDLSVGAFVKVFVVGRRTESQKWIHLLKAISILNVKEIEGTSADWVFISLRARNCGALESDTSALWFNVSIYGIWLSLFPEAEFYGVLN